MRRQTGGRANLFLMELVLNLLIFALCAAVCMGLLSRARSMSLESANLTRAVYLAQTAAETWRATGAVPPESVREGMTVRSEVLDGALHVSVTQGETLIYALEGVRAP